MKTQTQKRPGVIATIIEVLSRGTKDKPVFRQEIFDELCRRFPDRDPEGMRVTLKVQMPQRLWTEKSLIVLGTNKEGYYLIK